MAQPLEIWMKQEEIPPSSSDPPNDDWQGFIKHLKCDHY